MNPSSKKGFGMIEVLIGAAIILLVISGIGASYATLLKAGRASVARVQAEYLLTEGGEAVRMLAEENWTSFFALTPGTTYYLEYSGSLWGATTIQSMIDGTFVRTVTLERVYRNGSDDIAVAGTEDASARKAVVSVAWPANGATTTKTLTTYLLKDE